MNENRYTRMGNLLATLQRLTEAREIVYLASISCSFHGLKTVPGDLSYSQKVEDRLAGLDSLITEMREDIARQCVYEEDEREHDGGIDLSFFPGPNGPA